MFILFLTLIVPVESIGPRILLGAINDLSCLFFLASIESCILETTNDCISAKITDFFLGVSRLILVGNERRKE